MPTPLMGEIKIVAFNFAPQGWALCNGQFLPINQNQALFSILGTTYGGNGQTTFRLPDFRDRTAIHVGNFFSLGMVAGEDAHTLSTPELAPHIHILRARDDDGIEVSPADHVWGKTSVNPYLAAPAANTAMAPGTITSTGGNQPHENRQPYLVLNFIIALTGVFPSRN
ncbi:MAG TPA: phage tail protein [Blastocatellia bacterium]|nr:phage tail protein [Blastocatellia bacterium]